MNQQSVRIHVLTHIHGYTYGHWFDVATEHISSLVGLYVDVRSLDACTSQTHK